MNSWVYGNWQVTRGATFLGFQPSSLRPGGGSHTVVCRASTSGDKQQRPAPTSSSKAAARSASTPLRSVSLDDADSSIHDDRGEHAAAEDSRTAEDRLVNGSSNGHGQEHSSGVLRPSRPYEPPSEPGPSNRSPPERSAQAKHGASSTPKQAHANPGRAPLSRLGRRDGAAGAGGQQRPDGPMILRAEDAGRAVSAATSAADDKPDLGTFWGLLVLGLAYVHHSTTGFALPALLPLITPDLHLTDTQGSMLTAGYTVLYALALIPAGFLADKADRPRLLAGGLGLWSVLTMVASKVNGFSELLATRVFFAAAQATQNPICFSLIPELFRRDRTTAMAAYNSAIYMGRALSFAAVIVAGRLGMAKSDGGVTMVPLDSLDLSHVSILYTQGEMAAITPIYDYQFSILHSTVTVSSWRQLLFWLGPPGLVIAALALLTLDEPRKPAGSFLGDVFSSSKFTNPATRDLNRSQRDSFESSAVRRSSKRAVAAEEGGPSLWESVRKLCGSPVFQAVTFAAALNDVGSWALVSWQATFYQRVYELGPETYAPALAGILPVGGIIGGVGGGLMGDWLSKRGGLHLLTAGATIAAAPVLVGNILAPDSRHSFMALLVGFALSEMWRAPAAIMIRDVSPPNLGSTGSALHLCFRNLVGGAGPISVAVLSQKIGLQRAMLLVPACYFLSGVSFLFAHRIQDSENSKAQQASREA